MVLETFLMCCLDPQYPHYSISIGKWIVLNYICMCSKCFSLKPSRLIVLLLFKDVKPQTTFGHAVPVTR